ncbi:hypothetical protein QTH97_02325 [Variovorax sp. J22R24]|uniref:hypothetical protein n=1 Tax=Variovorax gracilis TaxID=3053502 RepID=UPI0025778EB8|nr:hypothetical protein [Variovorax sp. J22R24]MDM0103753.1 hypothetical protein [Variovorax sp. J22R24]
MDDNLRDWKRRMVKIKAERIEPPEPSPAPRVLAPGYVAFAYRIGIVPRTGEALWDWRGRMVAERKLRRN